MTRVSIPYAEISVPYFYDAMSGTPTHEVQKGLFASLSSSGTLLYPFTRLAKVAILTTNADAENEC